MREIALELLERVDKDKSYANLLLPKLLERANLAPRDSAFVQELAFGVLRNRLLYDGIIAAASGRLLTEIDSALLNLLRIGTHQLLAMRVPNHAAIFETVELAKTKLEKSGATGFLNAVLRKIASKDLSQWSSILASSFEDTDDKLSTLYSHPIWIVKAFRAALLSRGLEQSLKQLLDADNTAPKVSLVALPGAATTNELFKDGASEGPASPIGVEIQGNPSDFSAVREGRARVQDQGSQLAALALTNVPLEDDNKHWLDMCAGPGGKAALLASQAAQENAHLTCLESQPHRAKLVSEAIKGFARNATVSITDARTFTSTNQFSRILLDAPCSGLGALRRRPEARWRKNQEDLKDLSKLQRELLSNAWQLLKPQGVLAYVTCSPHLSETTAQVVWMESQFRGEIELLSATVLLNSISPDLKLDENFRTAQLWPHLNQTDAMFIALFRKSVG